MPSFDEAKLTTTLRGTLATYNPSTGANKNADSLPTGLVYKISDGTTLAATVTVANITTGVYRFSVDVTTGNGFAAGEYYELWITAVVSGDTTVTQSAPITAFKATTSTVDSAVSVGSIAANAINASALATDAVTEIQSGLATQTSVDALGGAAAVTVERSISDTKAITFAWPVSGATITGTRSIDNAAYGAVTGAIAFLRTETGKHYYTIAYNVADRPSVEGQVRYKFIDGTYTRYVVLRVEIAALDSAARVKLDATQPDYAPALATTALSTTQWTNTLATNLGTTNTTVATNLNTTVSSRATQTSVDAIDDLLDTEMPALTAAVAAEAVKTSAIKTKTDNLPTDPADQSLLEAAITAATSPLATPAQVNAQVLDVLSVDTFAELTAPPAATSSLKDKITWLFMYARNKVTQTATQRKVYLDDTTTVAGTSGTSDNGTTFTKGEDA